LERAELAPVSQVSKSVVGEERSDIWLATLAHSNTDRLRADFNL